MNTKLGLRHYIGDALICAALAVLLILISVAFSATNNKNNDKVRVLQDGKEIAVYSLSDNVTLNINGVRIEIRDGKAFIGDSDCDDKVCMNMPGVDKSGGGSVCIPNRIVLEPLTDSDGTDAVAG